MAPKFELSIAFLLLYILSLHAIAVFFFTRGFLLTRNELPLFSHCDDLLEDVGCNLPRHNVPAAKIYYNSSSSNTVYSERENEHFSDQRNLETMPCNALHAPGPSCWTSPAVKKVVILVFDALRFDFVAPSDLYNDKPRPWMDKLQVMQKLIMEESSQAKLFKFIADPPTTSLQRLKGLTTGSLPTFIDVGNSFGAPAIVEDNIIHQLTSNGKKVIMMGDDTWLQLFPSQFSRTFPFPSFNVKDLHTVDDGVIENLFPALYEDNWDVLIGHFLGVDHIGHIFGVESPHMVEKLEQYNKVVEDVLSVLQDQSYLGGLHDDTLLLVMGDHGQTLNGDHGGGTVEEVETALFAWSSQQPAHPTSQTCHPLCIKNPARANQSCICEFQQLDFAATLAAVLGVPFPFGSIGKVNPQLLGLVAGMWLPSEYEIVNSHGDDWLALKWLEVYSNVLCLNSWQVNRYFEQYSESLLNGFSMNDIVTLHNVYDNARSTLRESSVLSETPPNLDEAVALLADGVERYTKYLHAAAALARSKWTQFSDDLMAFGLVILFISLVIQMTAVYNLGPSGFVSLHLDPEYCRKVLPLQEMMKSGLVFGMSSAIISIFIYLLFSLLPGGSLSFSSRQFILIIVGGTVFGTTKSYLFKRSLHVAESANMKKIYCRQNGRARPDLMGALTISFCCVYACSLLSNSFILREQQVVTFLLVSIGVLDLRMATQRKSKVPQALCFLVMNFIMSSLSESNLFKDTGFQTRETMSRMAPASVTSVIWPLLFLCFTTYGPLAIVGCFFVKKLWRSCLLHRSCLRIVFFGVPLSYAAICLHWFLDDLENLQLLSLPAFTQVFVRLQIPRMVYLCVALQSLLLLCDFKGTGTKNSKIQFKSVLEEAAVLCLGVWSGLVLLLLGRCGPAIALITGIEGWCLLDKQSLYAPPQKSQTEKSIIVDYSVGTIQWSLFAVQLFFFTGHRCAFDGLHYAAAFIGFDQFNIYRQGVLLALDTFGASHILPAVGLALLVAKRTHLARNISLDGFYKLEMSQAFLLYGLVRTVTATFTTLCVTIQRRHLMVWGLFAPKFVFDAIGMLVTDVVLLITFLYYMIPFLR